MPKRKSLLVVTPTKRGNLSNYLENIKSALDKKDLVKAKRYGEIALKKLSSLSCSPNEEYFLYSKLGSIYYRLSEYSNALNSYYKAYSIALRHSLPPVETTYPLLLIGDILRIIKNTNQALIHLQKIEQYFQKHGGRISPMIYRKTLISLGYCYLEKNELEKTRQILEEKMASYLVLSSSTSADQLFSIDYHHLKGEYQIAIEKYSEAKQSFRECIRISNEVNYPHGMLAANMHLAVIDLSEGRLKNAIYILQDILKNARRLKKNEFICESALLLSRCYMMNNLPEKSSVMEKMIKPLLTKLDAAWLYEKNKEFEQLFRQLPNSQHRESRIPRILTETLLSRYEKSATKYTIVGNSPAMQEIYHLMEKISPTDMPVLIQGETGTGKELIANAIHNNSRRVNKIYLPFNCGAMPDTLIESTLFGHTKGAFTGAIEEKKGYIELTSGGTLFIDEIANMSPSMQQKLLRILEEKLLWRVGGQKPIPVDTRFIFASNQDIEQMVKRKLFREYLFYRINTIVINLPPLRDRKDDIHLLAQHFLQKYGRPSSLVSPSALSLFSAYPWPGNIRELENEIKRIYVLYPDVKLIEESMLSDQIRTCLPASAPTVKDVLTLKEMERNAIIETIKSCNGNITQTAQQLGCDRAGLHRKIKRFNISLKIVTKK